MRPHVLKTLRLVPDTTVVSLLALLLLGSACAGEDLSVDMSESAGGASSPAAGQAGASPAGHGGAGAAGQAGAGVSGGSGHGGSSGAGSGGSGGGSGGAGGAKGGASGSVSGTSGHGGSAVAGAGGAGAGGQSGASGEAGAVGGPGGSGEVSGSGGSGLGGASGSGGEGGTGTGVAGAGPTVCDPEATFYKDEDGDGYGDPGKPYLEVACPTSSEWVDNGDDCNDANAQVFIGQTAYFDKGYLVAGGGVSFDYDCSGSEEHDPGIKAGAVDCKTGDLSSCASRSGALPTDRKGPGVDPLCGSEQRVDCTSGFTACKAATSSVPGVRCR